MTRAGSAERRALQCVVALAALVPLLAGADGVWSGGQMIHGVSAATPDLNSHFRYLSGLLLGIGLAFAALIPTIERHKLLFGVLGGIVMVGGAGRLLSGFIDGFPAGAHRYALVMELIVVPLLVLWQRRVANQSRSKFN
ncbi:putative membrane protein YedE/YeeE [Sphingomonas sp. F9_3S_D5_B_2]